jgi:hypothetical protein
MNPIFPAFFVGHVTIEYEALHGLQMLGNKLPVSQQNITFLVG